MGKGGGGGHERGGSCRGGGESMGLPCRWVVGGSYLEEVEGTTKRWGWCWGGVGCV